MKIVEWAFWLILAYILVSNWKGTVQIGNSAAQGLPPVITALQGVGSGYPAPAR